MDGSQAVVLEAAKNCPQQARSDQREPDDQAGLDSASTQAMDDRPLPLVHRLGLTRERRELSRERRGLVSSAHNGEIADPASREVSPRATGCIGSLAGWRSLRPGPA